MLIASKYEEIWAPEVNDFVYISDKAYTRCAHDCIWCLLAACCNHQAGDERPERPMCQQDYHALSVWLETYIVPLSCACSEDILGMEKQMLATLQYDLTVPTCYLFNARFRKAAGVQDDLKVGTAR
jgi:hypothetical protein